MPDTLHFFKCLLDVAAPYSAMEAESSMEGVGVWRNFLSFGVPQATSGSPPASTKPFSSESLFLLSPHPPTLIASDIPYPPSSLINVLIHMKYL